MTAGVKVPKTKTCNACGKRKPLSGFYKHSRSKYGVLARCRVCVNSKTASWTNANRARVNELAKIRYYKDHEQHKANQRRWKIKSTFGITIEQYDAMLESQGGGCAICGSRSTNGKRLPVDHDHRCCPGPTSCGECVRGILCNSCNQAIGQLKDDPHLMKKAIKYIRRSNGSGQ